MNLFEKIAAAAANQPQEIALIDGERTLTYAELADKALRWSSALKAQGLRQGDVVGIALRERIEHVVAIFACAHSGLTILPVDWRARGPALDKLLLNYNASLLLQEPRARPTGAAATLKVDDEWLKHIANVRANPAAAAPETTTLVIKLSSGTTGEPRGAIVRHIDILERIERSNSLLPLSGRYRYLSVLPLCQSAGFNYCVNRLASGDTLVLYPPLFTAEELVTVIHEQKIDFTMLAPTILRWLLNLPTTSGPLLAGLRVLLTSMSPLTATEKLEITEKISPNFFESYSMSAIGAISGWSSSRADPPDSVGRTADTLDIEIVDDDKNILPVGEVGLIRCRGRGISLSYYDEENKTEPAESISDGWCYTGDLGMFDEQDFLYLKGRADDTIIRGGINIYPAVIEQALMDHLAVIEAAVVGIPDDTHGQEIAAFISVRTTVPANEIRAHAMSLLPENSVPRDIHIVAEFPRTETGKIVKRELAKTLTG